MSIFTNNDIKSILILSFKQLKNVDLARIFLFHFLLTFAIAGIAIFFINDIVFDFLSNAINSMLSFFSKNNSSRETIIFITKLLTYIFCWFIFTYLLIPISGITGMIFEENIFKRILNFRNVNFIYTKNDINIIYLLIFIMKNIFFYIILNLIAIPFYLSLPAINILIFITLNGYILGMQTYHGIILSYFDKKEIRKRIAANRFDLFVIGTFLTLLFLIPIINFFAPLLSIIIFLNFFISKDYMKIKINN